MTDGQIAWVDGGSWAQRGREWRGAQKHGGESAHSVAVDTPGNQPWLCCVSRALTKFTPFPSPMPPPDPRSGG